MATSDEFTRGGVVNYLIDLPVRGMFAMLGLLPYRASLALAGGIASRVLAPAFGANRRIRANLAHVLPQLEAAEITRLCRQVSANSARLMVESFRTADFIAHASRAELAGPGVALLLEALENSLPVVLVSGHFGNYQVLRVLLRARGFDTAAIYRPMNNAFTNKRYIDNMNRIATPNFPRGMKGTKGLLRHLRAGGAIALLNDQAALEGERLHFMGKPAMTMTSAAEFAIKHGALLIPYYGIRLENGVDFRVEVETPISPGTPTEMTQALNDSLERRVREYPSQWFWIHRRWKWA